MFDVDDVFAWSKTAVRRRLSIDPRALAAARITLAAALLIDLALRLPDITAFYTDEGVVPRSLLQETYPAAASYSLHAFFGSLGLQLLLFGMSAMFAVMLLLGFRSRTAAAASAVLLLSLHLRNPYVVNGGDTLLFVLLVLLATQPVGGRWAVDAYARWDRPKRPVYSPAAAASLGVLLAIYLSNAVLRFRGELWMNGDAVKVIFALEDITVYLGPVLAEHTTALTAINWIWIALLSTSFLLVALTGWPRALYTLSFVVAHVGMALTLRLGVFPIVVIAALLLYLPPEFWNQVEHRLYFQRFQNLGGETTDKLQKASDVHVMPEALRDRATAAFGVFAVVLLAVIVLWQVAALGYVSTPADGSSVDPDSHAWKMYAPNPPTTTGWYVVTVESSDGERFDGLHGGDVSYEPPDDLADQYPTTMWYRYLNKIRRGTEGEQRGFAEYVCRTAGTAGGSEPVSVTVEFVERSVAPDSRGEETTLTFVEHSCLEADR